MAQFAVVGFKVTDPTAPARAVQPDMLARARRLRDDAAAGTPRRTGRLAAGWEVRAAGFGYRVVNDVEYARFVEYGHRVRGRSGRRVPPVAMLGRAIARAQARG